MKLLFFSSSAGETTSRLRSLEQRASFNPHLLALLDGTLHVLRQQARSFLDRPERAEFGVDLTSLVQLAEQSMLLHPAKCVLDLVVQLGETILFMTDNPRSNDPQDLLPVGVGCGLLTAAVVAASDQPETIVKLGLAIIAVTFRLAVELDRRARRVNSSAGSWTYLETSAESAKTNAVLEEVNRELPAHRRAYIGIRSNSIMISGPSDTLANLPVEKAEIKTGHDLPGSMFASHLPPLDQSMLLEPLKQHGGHPVRHQICSPSDGKPYQAKNLSDLVKNVIEDLSARSLDLFKLAESTAAAARQLRSPAQLVAIGSESQAMTDFHHLMLQHLDLTCFPAELPQPEDPSVKRNLVAIVGMSGRFPESDNVDEFWSLLESGSSVVREIPSDRFSTDEQKSFRFDDREDIVSRFGNFLKDPGGFDHRLFGISPAEAIQMDPVQRLSLMVTYEALESAGYGGSQGGLGPNPARIATYLGQTTDDWKTINQQRGIDTHYLPAVNRSFAPGRLNRYFDWGGPFYSIDTGCSSSATCISLARDALLSGQIDMAVAGGGTLLTTPEWFEGLSRGNFLSTTGQCKTFVKSADGYCRGEAVGVVVLKRLEDAIEAKDNVLAVISSVARNSNARSSDSLTAPSQEAQERLYRQVLRESGVSAEDVGFVEMHGTGTQIGDRTEMAAVRNVFAGNRSPENPLILGGVKASIGHSEAAAGVVSLIKAILVLQHGKIPRQPGWPFVLNPAFRPFAEDHIQIANGQAFTRTNPGRNIAVNVFDAAGGNVSMMVHDSPAAKRAQDVKKNTRFDHVICVSGHSRAVCETQQVRLREHLLAHPDISISDLAYSTTARRKHESYRCVFTASSTADLIKKLAYPCNAIQALPNRPVCFVFTGQGSQYAGMGASLYKSSSDFRQLIDHYEQICQHDHHFGFLDVLIGAEELSTRSAGQVQVALVALQVALANHLISLGVEPTVVIGHSLGEYAALCVAGVLSVTDMLWLVYQRLLLLEQACKPSTFGMLAVNLSSSDIQSHGDAKCEVSCYNTPTMTTVSGPLSEISKMQEDLKRQDIKATRLQVEFAFHSSQMDPILTSFEKVAAKMPFHTPRIAVASTALGRIVEPGEDIFNAKYLARHMRDPVAFSAAVQACERQGFIQDKTVVIEVGPQPTCIGLLKSNLQRTKPLTLTTLQRGDNDCSSMATCLSQAFSAGLPVDWMSHHAPDLDSLSLVPLPSYAFNLRKFWEPFKTPSQAPASNAPARSLHSSTLHELCSMSETQTSKVATFASYPQREDLHRAIKGHSLDGIAICPTSILADMAFSAAVYLVHSELRTCDLSGLELTELSIKAPLTIDAADEKQTVTITAEMAHMSSSVEITISSTAGSRPNTVHASCQVMIARSSNLETWNREYAQIRHLVNDRLNRIGAMGSSEACILNRPLFYHIFDKIVQYSSSFQTVVEAKIPTAFRDAAAVLRPNAVSGSDKFLCDPYTIDSVVHLPGFMLNSNPTLPTDILYISNYVGSMRMHGLWEADQKYQAFVATRDTQGGNTCTCDVYILDGSQKLVLSCTDIRFQRLGKAFFRDLVGHQSGSLANGTHDVGKSGPSSVSSDSSFGRQSKILTPATTSGTSSGTPDPLGALISIISGKSGLSREDIHSGRSLTEMGIDSQLSISITAEFRKQTGMELPAALLNSGIADIKRELHCDAPMEETTLTNNGGLHQTNDAFAEQESIDSNTLINIVIKTLGIERNELDDSTSWASIGMDSMQSISTLSALKKENGIELPASFFMDHPTVALACQELGGSGDAACPAEKDVCTEMSQGANKSSRKQNPVSRAILLQGSARSKDPPLFLMTDGSGTTEAYIHFPKLPGGRRTYGLESPFVNNPLDFDVSQSELASIFVDSIRSVQPSGPYFIGGWSMGGKYAYEVSRQLSLAGEEIALLLIMDTRPPRPRPAKFNVEQATIQEIGVGAHDGNMIDEFTQRERDHLLASCRTNTVAQKIAFSEGQRPPHLSAIVWATRGMNEHADRRRHNPNVTRKAAMGPVEDEEAEIEEGGTEAAMQIYRSWFFGKRQDFGTNGWEKWILGTQDAADGRNNDASPKLVVETVEADHFSMIKRDVSQLGEIVVRMVEQAHSLLTTK